MKNKILQILPPVHGAIFTSKFNYKIFGREEQYLKNVNNGAKEIYQILTSVPLVYFSGILRLPSAHKINKNNKINIKQWN